MPAVFNVGILGMGRIACGFDTPEDAIIRTHLKAVLNEPRLTIAAVSDRDEGQAAAEAHRFKLTAEVIAPEAMLSRPLDILCIASPDGTHLAYAEKACNARVLLLEKPVEGDAARRAGALAALAARGARLTVVHIRRFIPPLAGWIGAARVGGYGRMVSAVIHYGRGLRHNAVHGLDLVTAIIGTDLVCARELADPIVDFSEDDPTRTLGLRLRAGERDVPVVLLGLDGRIQTAFTVDLRFERARILVEDVTGVHATLSLAEPIGIAGFAPELRPVEFWSEAEVPLMTAMWRHLADHLEGRVELRAADRASLAVYDLLDALETRLRERTRQP